MPLTESAGEHGPRRYVAAGLIAGLALAGTLGVAGCGFLGRQEPVPEPVVDRPSLPPSGPRLASLAVFPAATAPLEVARSQPADGAEGTSVARDEARIVIQFNHPVVPLVAPDQQAGLPQPLTIEPAIPGRGEWLNTSTYQWLPATDLAPSTQYTLIVGAGITDVLGAALASPARITFTTATPAVVATYPAEGAIDAGATRPISVTFNQPMDRPSAQEAFSVAPADGGPGVQGKFGWLGGTMIMTPTRELEREAEYVATVAAGAKAAAGDAATAADYSWKFTIAPRPRLVSSTPEDGAAATPALRSEPLFLRFNTPMGTDAVTVTIQPTIANRALWWIDGDTTARIGGDWIASTAYTVTIKDTSESRFGDQLGDDATIHFTTAPQKPALILQTPGQFGVFDASRAPRVFLDAVNKDNAQLALYRLDAGAFLDVAVSENRRQSFLQLEPPESATARRWTVDTSGPVDAWRRVSTTLSADPSGLLDPGVYLLQSDGENESVLAVSRINLVLKQSSREALVWATDFESAQPVPDLPLRIYAWPAGRGDNGPAGDGPRNGGPPSPRVLAEGTTDADGLFRATFDRRDNPWEPIAVVSEDNDTVVAAAVSGWDEGIEPYAFGFPFDPTGQPYYAALYTDRPIYRPGQRVFFRGVLRRDSDATYSLPDVQQAHVVVRDPNYQELLSTDLEVGPFGTFNGQLDLSAAAALGGYQVEAQLPYQGDPESLRTYANTSFRVAAYRKPEFEVTVTTAQPEYRHGDTMEVSVAARYFFGGAVADAEVTWRLLSDDFFFDPHLDESYSFIDYDLTESRYGNAQAEVITDGEGALDRDGRLTFQIPADVSDFPLSQVFTIDVEVTDINHQAVSGRASAVVHKADFYVGLRPRQYVGAAGTPVTFDVLALDPEAKPASGRQIDLELFQRTWYSVREQREGGGFAWTSSFTDTLVADLTVTTDSAGRAEAELTPTKGGIHRLVAQARDAAGNEVSSAVYVWVTDRGFTNWRQENNDRIELVADKREYQPGDVAKVLVPAPFEDGEALLTLERGTIRQVRRLHLTGNSETVDIPIESDYTPNVYVSIVLLKAVGPDSPLPQIKLGYTNLAVSDAEKVLDVEIVPDRPGPFGPRETVTYTLTARDSAGKAARAEFSAAVVDKALLALTDDPSRTLEDAFYGQRMLGISTAASLAASVERLNQQLATEKKGGGGGPADTGTTRRLFRDTAFWKADITTGADGRALVPVELPDNLTTWRMTVRGVTAADTLVGDATNEILSTKEVLVRPVVPRFLVVGDTLQLEAAVNSSAPEDIDVEVRLDAVGLSLSSEATQSLRLPAGGKGSVVWQVAVPDVGLHQPRLAGAFGEALIRMSVAGDGYDDSVELTLPAFRFSAPDIVATAGQVEDKVTEKIELPSGIDESQGELTVRIDPSLAAAAIDGLTWLESYPYECSEQIVSKFLPNVATYQALRNLDISALRGDVAEMQSHLEAQIAVQVQRLYALQHPDGGWGWWTTDASRPWTTAYALFGLQAASSAGFSVSDEVMFRARAYLDEYLQSPVDVEASRDLNQRAFALFVLAEGGDVPTPRVVSLFERRAGMSYFGQAFLALALARVEGDQSGRIKALVADLGGAAAASATGTHWQEKDTDWWSMGSDTRTTAVVAFALARLDPGNLNLNGAIRWLMAERGEGHWSTTQETAWAIMAMAEVLAATGDLGATYQYHVELNDEPMTRGQVTASSVNASETLTSSVADMLADRANTLVLRKTGRGTMYYSARLRAYRDVEALAPLNQGIIIGRQYFQVNPSTFQATGQAADVVSIGDIVQVKLTLVAPKNLHYVMVEDPLPAGFEAIDTSLKTTSAAAESPQLLREPEPGEGLVPWWRRNWWSYWVTSELRDEKVSLFATTLPQGTYEYTYLIRASLAGNFHVMPARAEEMYFPEVRGRSAGGVFVVTP